jgi:hypothetical protein
MKKSLLLIVTCFILQGNKAQFYQAVHGSNFAGSLGMLNNPASALASPTPWDITIFGIQARNSTNLFYLEKYGPGKSSEELLPFIKNGDFKKRLNAAINLNLVNARVKLSNHISVGMGLNFRSGNRIKTSTYNFQDSISEANSFLHINISNQPLQALVLSSSWMEPYGSMAFKIAESKNFILTAGISAKVTKGLFGLTTKLDNAFYESILPGIPVYQPTDIELQYGYSRNADEWDPSKSLLSNMKNYLGKSEGGGSFDFGVEWIVKDRKNIELFEERTQYNYTWKIGVSLLDLGYAKYKYGLLSRNASGIKLSFSGKSLFDKFDSTVNTLATFNDSLKTVVAQFSSRVGIYKVSNATRLVFNVDRTVSDLFNINAEFNLPLSIIPTDKDLQLQTLPSITITPRIEGRKYGAYLPLTINGDGYFWMGAAFKAGPLLIGMHDVLPFLQKTPYPNGGGYLAYVISPSEKLKKAKAKDVKCPD